MAEGQCLTLPSTGQRPCLAVPPPGSLSPQQGETRMQIPARGVGGPVRYKPLVLGASVPPQTQNCLVLPAGEVPSLHEKENEISAAFPFPALLPQERASLGQRGN
ncbi:hypothetical protein KIL84_005546 [Mauremys mutica]|uniref:Uncharacterized protein n=1 Tax=Mauremys mutica TaxID=74926 RepID=A0A9D3WNG7_9SAUR|nr:hypothetical protein KIL84_005546 [Mauremys mutica]